MAFESLVKFMKKIILFSIFFLLLPVFPAGAAETDYEKARVLDLKTEERSIDLDGAIRHEQVRKIKLKILGGQYKNQEFEIENSLSGNPLDMQIREGDLVLAFVQEEPNGPVINIQDYWRLNTIIFLVALFFLTLLVIGRKEGLKAIISLLISVFLIFEILIPRILSGSSPLPLALVIAVVITVVTLLIIGGANKKSLAAILGTAGGFLAAAILSVIFGEMSKLNGMSSEEARILANDFPDLNLKGVLFAGIIIGAVGAVMDVAMSIASSMAEIKKARPDIGRFDLFKSGLNVGKDIMGTMSNTLIFAYVGSSIILIILFMGVGESFVKFVNFDFVAEEFVRSLAGSIGLIASIPLTAFIASFLYKK